MDGKEVALRVIPEGSEFFRRWRYSDIRRFLDGETVHPGEVFTTIHNLFKQYIDFRSGREPYCRFVAVGHTSTDVSGLSLSGAERPKNSGK